MYMKIFLILLIPCLIGCTDAGVDPEIGEEIKIPFQRTIRVQDSESEKTINIQYTQLIENSICRPDQICVWQGRFVVEIQIDEAIRTIGLGDNFSLENDSIYAKATYSDYEIELLDGNEDFVNVKIKKILDE